ncbi:hypothetical protein E8E11_006305 [Didymella keratinophila]|nr:hypothetical protein E8E11_006305 [Didymella keratinophila]
MSFDVTACTSPHNTIVARAIARLPEHLRPDIVRNWFTTYNVDVADPGLPVELTVPLKEFLSGIDIVKPRNQAQRIAFTRFSVAFPSPARCCTEITEDPGGLIMYLNEHAVAFVETSEDEPHELEYGLLENALVGYLNYIDVEKFVVDTSYELGGYGDAGLYLSPDEVMTNAVSMLLPFPVGGNGHVLRSDGGTSDKASHDALYHHGVFDENGVAGGGQKWRMTDTREHAEAFEVAADCMPPDGDEGDEQDDVEDDREGDDNGDEGVHSSANDGVDAEDGNNTEQEGHSAPAVRSHDSFHICIQKPRSVNMSFLLRTARFTAPTIAHFTTPVSQRAFSTTLKMPVTIDSNLLSQITTAEKTLTNKEGPITDGPTARAQKHVGQQLTSQIISEITNAENAITGSAQPTKGGPTSVAQSALTNEGGAGSNSNNTSNNSAQHAGKLDSSTLHNITEAEKDITGQNRPVQGGPTAKAQQHANEPITSEALHDITEGEKKITGGERVKGGPTSQAQSELGKSRS